MMSPLPIGWVTIPPPRSPRHNGASGGSADPRAPVEQAHSEFSVGCDPAFSFSNLRSCPDTLPHLFPLGELGAPLEDLR